MAMPRLATAIFRGGLLGGALDLLFAVSFAACNGAPPARVFQAIASGWLGSAASSGGLGIEALGVASHFALSIAWAGVFALAASMWPALARRPLLAAIAFGCVVFLCMRLVVLPLSAYPKPVTFKPLSTTLDLLSHMFLFALPIVSAVGRALGARKSGPMSQRGIARVGAGIDGP